MRASGAAVDEIDGLSGGQENGKPVEWFSYVNGIATPDGAADRKLYKGDRIWYDHHGAGSDVSAVVGSFPQPFTTGIDGKKLPIKVVCQTPGGPLLRRGRGAHGSGRDRRADAREPGVVGR